MNETVSRPETVSMQSPVTSVLSAEDPASAEERRFPMRVIMISDSGEMLTLILPASMEGRYRFTGSSGAEGFPFFFEQRNNSWTVVLEHNAQFFFKTASGDDPVAVREQAMISGSFLRLRYGDKNYILYVEEERPDDHIFVPYFFEHSDYIIGRSSQCHLYYKHNTVSREHARLHWNGTVWEISDLNSTNGTYVNGRKVDFAKLSVGDVVFIVGLYIVVGAGFLSINNRNGRVNISTPMIHPLVDERDFSYASPMVPPEKYGYYDRMPRRMLPEGAEEIEIEMPPMSLRGNNIPLLLRLGSPMIMGGHALMTGNLLMAMSGMVMPMLTQGFTERTAGITRSSGWRATTPI